MQITIILWQIICLTSYFSQTNLILLVKNKLNKTLDSLKGKHNYYTAQRLPIGTYLQHST